MLLSEQSGFTPPLDYGLFGPESMRWKVVLNPLSVLIGGLRASTVEMFDPFVLAAVSDTGAVLNRSQLRYERGMEYLATVSFGDSEQVVRTADVLTRIHTRIRGTEPVSGLGFDANDPDSQLWILLTEWQSALYVYERFGVGHLSEEEDRAYWAECRRAAQCQTIDPEMVPRSRLEMRAYYERVRPRLAVTDTTAQVVSHILGSASVVFGGLPPALRPMAPALGQVIRRATIATMPLWMRRLVGIRQSAAADAAAIATVRAAYLALPHSRQRAVNLLETSSPRIAKLVVPRLLEIEPVNPVVVTPAEAWERAGKPIPRQQYAQLLADLPKDQPAHAPADPGAEQLLQFS